MDLAPWPVTADFLVKLAVSYVLALPVAWDRERAGRSAGLRTFPLVATAATAYVLIAGHMYGGDARAQARVVEGLITGIGFIGGGAILRGRTSVHGTATAASVWATAAIGVAAAYGLFTIAIALSVINFVTLRFLKPFKVPRDEPGMPGREAEER